MPLLTRPGFAPLVYEESVKNPPSPEYMFGPGANRVRRVLEFPWSRRHDAPAMFTGFPEIKQDVLGARWLSRSLPDALPDFKGKQLDGEQSTFLYATSIESLVGIAPTGKTDVDGIAEYQRARMSLVYESLTYGVKSDARMMITPLDQLFGRTDESSLERFVTLALKPAAEFIALPRGIMQWATNPTTRIDFASSKLLQFIEIHLIWRQVPVIPVASITHVACVNRDPFVIGSNNEYQSITFPPETLLLLNADTTRYRLPSGHSVFDINYRLKHISAFDKKGVRATHNKFLRYKETINSLEFDEIVSLDVPKTKLFEAKDFKLLFYPQAF